MVEYIFSRFDDDKDGALDLIEVNSMQRSLGAEMFTSSSAYHLMLSEEGYCSDGRGNITLEGLLAAYCIAGPEELAMDIFRLGCCALADAVEFTIQTEFNFNRK